MNHGLKTYKELKSFYEIVDVLASEYGWSIEYIQNLTEAEVACLLSCICKRHNPKDEKPESCAPEVKLTNEDCKTNIQILATALNMTPEQKRILAAGGTVVHRARARK